ncbi:MAG: peptidoglycan-binding protein, partial [Clostridium sp.]
MNKRLKLLTCALVTIFSLSIVVNVPIPGPFGVDAVSAATDDAPVTTPTKTPAKTTTTKTPAKPTTTKTPTTPSAKTTTKSTTITTTNSTSSDVSRLLRFNSMGSDVKLVQTSLNNKGYKLTVDGIYGKLTLAAVRNYQGKNGLAVDGIVGPATCGNLIPKPLATKTTSVTRLLKSGSVGADVKLLQT